MTIQPPQAQTTKDRLLSLLDIVIKQSKLNPAFLPVIKNLAVGFINDIDNSDLENRIGELRDRYIPWLLGEGQDHEQNTS